MPSCAPSTQGRRLPIGRNWKRSISGPDNSLKAHGRMMTARKEAIWPAPTPWLASHAGTAMFIRPKGMPCAKYMDEPAA